MIKIETSRVTARCDWCSKEFPFNAVADPCNPWLILRDTGWAKVTTRAGETHMCPSCDKEHQGARIKQYIVAPTKTERKRDED